MALRVAFPHGHGRLDLIRTQALPAQAPPNADERLGFEFLFDDAFVVVAGVQHPWARRRKIALADLVNVSWVLPPPESVIGSAAKEALRASRLSSRDCGYRFPRGRDESLGDRAL